MINALRFNEKKTVTATVTSIGSNCSFLFFCDPLGVRTQDPNIKSVVLYRLS